MPIHISNLSTFALGTVESLLLVIHNADVIHQHFQYSKSLSITTWKRLIWWQLLL